MPRVCLTLALVILAWLIVMQAYAYVEGQSFDKSWAGPLSVLPMGVCFLVYLVTGCMTLVGAIRKKVRWRWVLAIFTVTVGWTLSFRIPMPGYTDGMRDGLRAKVPRERLQLFANRAKEEARKPKPAQAPDQLPDWIMNPGPVVDLMKRDFPDIYALSPLPPRALAGEGGVEIFWGSALVKHWGITIGRRPFHDADAEYLKLVTSREVYDGVWVYHDSR